MKTTLLIILGSLLWSNVSLAEVWYVPQLEADQELWVFNSSGEDEVIWLAPPQTGPEIKEASFEIAPKGSLRISKSDITWQSNWTQIKSRRGHPLRILMKQSSNWSTVPMGRTNVRGISDGKAEALFVNNLGALSQKGYARIQNLDGSWSVKNFELGPFEQTKITLADPRFSHIEVQTEMNVLAHIWNEGRVTLLPTTQSEIFTPAAGVRFLMADPDRTQSFVVELSNPEMIESAREQIRHPDNFQARILIADLAARPKDVNQDLLSPLQGPWSWHVENPVSFAEFALQDCDTSPDQVEDLLGAWFESGLRVCMWNYHVVKELGPVTTELAP